MACLNFASRRVPPIFRSINIAIVLLLLSSGAIGTGGGQNSMPHLIFGFSQIAGFGTPQENPDEWVLTEEELAILKSDFHVNALRFFIHPAFIGLPQLTWIGPESIRYSSFPDSAFVWNRPGGAIDSLDEIIAKLRQYDILPVFWVVSVDEYLRYLNRPDLSFLNDPTNTYFGQPNPLNYTGINPKDELKFLATKIAGHIHSTFGDDFVVNFPEIGAIGDSCSDRVGDGESSKWNDVVHAVRGVAPNCLITSPELRMSFWHWAAAIDVYSTPFWGANPLCPLNFGQAIPCLGGDAPPRSIPISDYSNVFDMVSASLYPDLHFGSDYPCKNHPLRKMADTLLKLLREQTKPGKWFWAEAGWGSPGTDGSDMDGFHLDWAANLLVPDNMGGFLLWQAKSLGGNP